MALSYHTVRVAWRRSVRHSEARCTTSGTSLLFNISPVGADGSGTHGEALSRWAFNWIQCYILRLDMTRRNTVVNTRNMLNQMLDVGRCYAGSQTVGGIPVPGVYGRVQLTEVSGTNIEAVPDSLKCRIPVSKKYRTYRIVGCRY